MVEALWHALTVVLTAETDTEGPQVDLLSGLLYEIGMQGMEIQDTAVPPQLVISFVPEADPAQIIQDVQAALTQADVDFESLTVADVAPVDWANHWKRHFVPLQFGRLWVVPSWLEAPTGAEHILWVDPSSAFGTGLHATTALCLRRIDEISPIASVLDVGTGTGVLAMAACKLGALRVMATDNDPEAVRVAIENADKNDMTERMTLSGVDVAAIDETFDLVVANILAGPLEDMAPALCRTVAAGGRLMLSGILGTQAEDVKAAYVAQGMVDVTITPDAEWVRIDLRKQG
jgi:ribosomal protein L11 methyltransferase